MLVLFQFIPVIFVAHKIVRKENQKILSEDLFLRYVLHLDTVKCHRHCVPLRIFERHNMVVWRISIMPQIYHSGIWKL